MYHIIDTYLPTLTIMALCAAFPVLRPYCYPQSYRHIIVYISKYMSVELYQCLELQDNSIHLSPSHELGYAGTMRGILSLVSDLTHDLTSIELDIRVTWSELDEYVKVYILALLQRSGLSSVKLKNCDIPVNLLSVVQNLKALDVNMSPGPPDNVSLSGERGQVYVEEVCLYRGRQDCLIGPGTPFNWSRLRMIQYYGFQDRPQRLLKLCSSSLQVLEISFYDEYREQLFIPHSP